MVPSEMLLRVRHNRLETIPLRSLGKAKEEQPPRSGGGQKIV